MFLTPSSAMERTAGGPELASVTDLETLAQSQNRRPWQEVRELRGVALADFRRCWHFKSNRLMQRKTCILAIKSQFRVRGSVRIAERQIADSESAADIEAKFDKMPQNEKHKIGTKTPAVWPDVRAETA